MGRTVARRLLGAVPLLFAVSTLLFLAIEALPGDASDVFFLPEFSPDVADRIRANLGLDEPFLVRWWRWVLAASRLDFQVSLVQHRAVSTILAEALPFTLALSGSALVLMFAGGILVGLAGARRAGSAVDRALGAATLFVYSVPTFWSALLAILVFATEWRLFPPSGVASVGVDSLPLLDRLLDGAHHLVLPAVSLAAPYAAVVARHVRAGLLEALASPYVIAARAKGLPERDVLMRHALRNALLPVVTLFGLTLPLLFGGAVLVETVFAWPGMGRVLVEAIRNEDYPLVLGGVFWITLLVVLGNLLADLLSAALDPRIRT
jgi:peptide/nickel transport system permease protein